MRRWLAALALSLPLPALAEQVVRQGDFIVHYAALPTKSLAPELAQTLGIKRSRHRGVLVINARRWNGKRHHPVPARAAGRARDAAGQLRLLALRQVRESEHHFAIAELETADAQALEFELEVRPEGLAQPVAVRFRQQFAPE